MHKYTIFQQEQNVSHVEFLVSDFFPPFVIESNNPNAQLLFHPTGDSILETCSHAYIHFPFLASRKTQEEIRECVEPVKWC